MTSTLPSADIRGYYTDLGIELPGWAHTEAPARCFANTDAHNHGDHDPSTSINLTNGTWHCHGCGTAGGAYDAAIATGHTPRTAIDLMIRHGLTQRNPDRRAKRARDPRVTTKPTRAPLQPDRPRILDIPESSLARWRAELINDARTLAQLEQKRGWSGETIRELELGLDRGRITIPVRNERRKLVGLLHYRPWRTAGQDKIRATPGSRRQLLPHPAAEPSKAVLLVEGEPDMIAARSHGLPAIAIPGAWQPEWAYPLSGREITIITDADRAGRRLARQVAHDLSAVAEATILDLTPERDDGYDLTDWLLDIDARQEPE